MSAPFGSSTTTGDVTTPSRITGGSERTVIRPFSDLGQHDTHEAGGKGANLGELTRAGMPVPDGFVAVAGAFTAFVEEGGIADRIRQLIAGMNPHDDAALRAAAKELQHLVATTPMPDWIADQLRESWRTLTAGDNLMPVAVRSSATMEDTIEASFAGMNETYLNIVGEEDVVDAVQRCWSSLFGARVLSYVADRGFDHADLAIAVVVQRQLASARSGVMFSADPVSGDHSRVVIEGAFGLGESVVSGQVTPDRFVVDPGTGNILEREIHEKTLIIEGVADGSGTVTREVSGPEAMEPALSHSEAQRLAQMARAIEDHYSLPQDIEWAFDANDTLWILQSRPITTIGHEATPPAATPHPASATMPDLSSRTLLVRGLGASPGAASGEVRILTNHEDVSSFRDGDILVTKMTAPDWVPVMRRAGAIVTDQGGMTCHAAIVSRELGIPCVVGTKESSVKLYDGQVVTVNATHGTVTAGEDRELLLTHGPAAAGAASAQAAAAGSGVGPVTATKLLVNLSEPSQVSAVAPLPVDGIGLLRAELMLLEALDHQHPNLMMAQGRSSEFVERMVGALTTFAAAFHPRPITYRTMDFRSHEFRGLRGGEEYEPVEANPMIGFRGAHRYVTDDKLFRLELAALRQVWDTGYRNLHVMLPFVRTPNELRGCIKIMTDEGMLDHNGFELWVMAEVPSVLFHLERYAAMGIAGISIGSNDLTQLLLGCDRDSELLGEVFDERDGAVVEYIQQLVAKARALGLKTSICGQAPSTHPDYAEMLVRCGIDAVSVSADAVDRTRRMIASAEQKLLLEAVRNR